MKKLLISSLIFSLLFVFSSAVLALEDLVPVGSNVVITKDVRDFPSEQLATGKKGKIIKYELVYWTLIDENCLFERKRIGNLPAGYKKWNPIAGEKWPGGKTGVPISTPVIQLEGGSIIKGNQCYWALVDEELDKKLKEILWERFSKWGNFMQKKLEEYKQKQK